MSYHLSKVILAFFGVIAHPVDHVRAPIVFNPLFADIGLPHLMVPIDAPPAHLEIIVKGLRAIPNFGGLAANYSA